MMTRTTIKTSPPNTPPRTGGRMLSRKRNSYVWWLAQVLYSCMFKAKNIEHQPWEGVRGRGLTIYNRGYFFWRKVLYSGGTTHWGASVKRGLTMGTHHSYPQCRHCFLFLCLLVCWELFSVLSALDLLVSFSLRDLLLSLLFWSACWSSSFSGTTGTHSSSCSSKSRTSIRSVAF